jgi:prophage regulatory protein
MSHTATDQPRSAPGRLLKMKDVARETSLHRATIYRRVAEGKFPSPVPIGGGRVAWPERDIEAWKDSILAAAQS